MFGTFQSSISDSSKYFNFLKLKTLQYDHDKKSILSVEQEAIASNMNFEMCLHT